MTDITFILKAKNEASRAAKQFSSDLKRAGTSAKDIQKNSRAAARETNKLRDAANKAASGFSKVSKGANLAKVAVSGLAAIVGGIAFGALFNQAITSAREFDAALAETSTLIEGTKAELDAITAASSDFARQYGGTAAQQAQAFYQTISAGVSDVADATALLDTANKLAVGGVTDTTTAVDILTTAVNAYGPEVLSAADASDSLFTAVRLGKTTVPELASSLGRVIPVAKSAGVQFDELNAITAALTSQGISTAEAVTGIRGVLAQIIKPTSEASKLAQKLGVDFSTAGVKAAGGLIPFLEDLIDKTGGSTETLGQLFGGVEGLVPVLSLAAGGIDVVNANLEEFANKGGATQAAYDKIAASLDKRFGVALDSLRERLRQVGSALLVVVVPALEALVTVVDFVFETFENLRAILQPVVEFLFRFSGIGVLVGLFNTFSEAVGGASNALKIILNTLLLFAGPVGAIIAVVNAVRALGDVSFEVQGVTVRLGDIVTGAAQRIADAFRNLVAPAVNFVKDAIDGLKQFFVSLAPDIDVSMASVVDAVTERIDGIVQIFVGVPKAIGVALSNLDVVFKNAFQLALNAAVKIVEKGINVILSKIRGLFAAIDSLAGTNFASGIGDVDLTGFEVELSPEAANLASDIKAAFESGGGIVTGAVESATADAVRNAQNAASDAALIAQFGGGGTTTPTTPTTTTTTSSGTSGGGGGGGSTQSALASTIDSIIGKYQELADTAGLTSREIEEYRIKQELLNAAQRDGVTLSPEVVESVLAQKRALEEAAEANATFQAGIRQGYQDFVDSLQTSAEFAADFTQNAIKGFTNLITDFVTTGKADFRGLIVDLLKQIAAFLANRLVIDFLGVAGGGTGGKGTTDFISSIFGGFFAEGGPVAGNKSYVVGEAGPELFVPRTAGTIIPNDEMSDFAEKGGGSRAGANITFNITTPDVDGFKRSEGQIRANMQRALAQADRRNN